MLRGPEICQIRKKKVSFLAIILAYKLAKFTRNLDLIGEFAEFNLNLILVDLRMHKSSLLSTTTKVSDNDKGEDDSNFGSLSLIVLLDQELIWNLEFQELMRG